MNANEKHNAKLMSECGISKDYQEGEITYWYVSGGKTMTTLSNEKVSLRDIVLRYGAARFEEGKDDIRWEFQHLLGILKLKLDKSEKL